MYGWYSEKVAKEIGTIYICKDKNNVPSMCTSITKENKCPYLEESIFGSDVISIGKLKECIHTIKNFSNEGQINYKH